MNKERIVNIPTVLLASVKPYVTFIKNFVYRSRESVFTIDNEIHGSHESTLEKAFPPGWGKNY